MKKTDNVESEYWNMVLGPEMWNIFMSGIGNMDLKYLPLLFTNISEMDGAEFCDVMAEIFGKTRRGKEILGSFVEEVMDELDYEDFKDSLGLKNMNKNMISDGYLTPEDLDVI